MEVGGDTRDGSNEVFSFSPVGLRIGRAFFVSSFLDFLLHYASKE